MVLDLYVGAELLHKSCQRTERGVSDSLILVLNASAGHLHSFCKVLGETLLASFGDEAKKGVTSLLLHGVLGAYALSDNRLAAGQSGLLTNILSQTADRASSSGDGVRRKLVKILDLGEPFCLIFSHFHEHLDKSGEENGLGLSSLTDGRWHGAAKR